MHDPVTPVVAQPSLIGWEAKERKVELQIERAFNGEELVRRMKGWITVDPPRVIETVNRFGRLKVLDDRELVVEVEKVEDLQNLQEKILGSGLTFDISRSGGIHKKVGPFQLRLPVGRECRLRPGEVCSALHGPGIAELKTL
jgi:hypothetical protein